MSETRKASAEAKPHQRRAALARYLYEAFGAMTLQYERRWYRIPPAQRQQWFDYADDIIGIIKPK